MDEPINQFQADSFTLHIPGNLTQFLWEFEASRFFECDAKRRNDYAKTLGSKESVVMKDKKIISKAMSLLVGESKFVFTTRCTNTNPG